MKEVKDYNPSKDPRLINCKTECGNDKCYARRYGLFAEKTCPNFVEPKPITNGDRIRAMSDEELAELISSDWCEIVCGPETYNCQYEDCQGKILNWLRQEAKESE